MGAAPRPRVLLVDDDPDSLAALEILLEPLGAELVKTTSGEQALQTLSTGNTFALILLDVRMPGLNGYETADLLRQDERTRSIPIIFLTSCAQGEEEVKTGYAHGAVDYLPKSFPAQLLRWKVSSFIELFLSRGDGAAGQRPQMLAEASQALRRESQELASLAQAITREVVRHMGDSSTLRLWSEPDRLLECVSLSHVNSRAQEELLQRLAGPSQRPSELHLSLASTGQSFFWPVVSLEELLAQALPEQRPTLERYPIHSWMAVPLVAHGRVLGTLDAVRHTPGRPFSPEDLRLLEEFASIAALSLEESRSLREQPPQEALRQQLEFEQKLIGIVSHDLRTPLGAIVMAAGLLQATPGLDERQRRAVHRILSSSDRATRLIQDFLDFTQAHLGQGIALKLQRVDLHDVIREVVSEVLQTSPGLRVSVEQRGDGQGLCDPDRLAQVVTNLVNNALTYGAPGMPVVVRSEASPGTFLLEVHNQGNAIPAELLPRLFDPLMRGAHSARNLSRNIGLGLFIVREIVRGHGGSIEVSSSQEAGTTFAVRLPRQ
ncbi:ATP-binding protein [Hyalangium minutum]|uniref:histidine kinase n=1 Tax=Hyalangium minutum TaxID=394096 RepID=A0A085W7B5_9BACT|nr:ATP-binding protein [Hyalangium minutum]KFE63578.1 hypothetical protein DB31_2696 [Hyalangium minutum]